MAKRRETESSADPEAEMESGMTPDTKAERMDDNDLFSYECEGFCGL